MLRRTSRAFDSLNACTRWHVNAVIAPARQAGRPAEPSPPAPFTVSQSSRRRNRVRHRLFPLSPFATHANIASTPSRSGPSGRTATRLLNSTCFPARARFPYAQRSLRSVVAKERGCGNSARRWG